MTINNEDNNNNRYPVVSTALGITMSINTTYIVTTGNKTMTLPATAPVGSVVNVTVIISASPDKVTVSPNAGQTIQLGVNSVGSDSYSNPVSFVCVVANTTWVVLISTGTLITVNKNFLNLALNSFIPSHVTGSGNFVGSNSPTFITPSLVAPTATSLTFTSTAGIIGTPTNNSPTAGRVGEVISSVIVTASAVSLVNATSKNITSVSVTAGDWDVWGVVWTKPAASTTSTITTAGISQTTNTMPTTPDLGTSVSQLSGIAVAANKQIILPIAPTRLSLSGTTTIYLVANITFAASTMSGYGAIFARRIR